MSWNLTSSQKLLLSLFQHRSTAQITFWNPNHREIFVFRFPNAEDSLVTNRKNVSDVSQVQSSVELLRTVKSLTTVDVPIREKLEANWRKKVHESALIKETAASQNVPLLSRIMTLHQLVQTCAAVTQEKGSKWVDEERSRARCKGIAGEASQLEAWKRWIRRYKLEATGPRESRRKHERQKRCVRASSLAPWSLRTAYGDRGNLARSQPIQYACTGTLDRIHTDEAVPGWSWWTIANSA